MITYVNKSFKAEASSVCPPFKQMEELWVVCVYVRKMEENYWWEHGHEKNNKLVEWKAFVDTMGIKSVDLTDKFLF